MNKNNKDRYVKTCPYCGKNNCVKNGFYKSKINSNKLKVADRQLYYCNDCKKTFRNKNKVIPQWSRRAYIEYANGKLLVELSEEYGKSIKTIRKYFHLIENETSNKLKVVSKKKKNNIINDNTTINNYKQSINLVFDGTFLK